MKKNKTNKSNHLFKMSFETFMPALVFTTLLIFSVNCKPQYIIDNPYEKADWKKYGRFKADLHIHTSRSDGHLSPHVIVDRFHDLGYSILAIADHNLVTYPWQEFSSFKAGNFASRLQEQGLLDYLPYENVFVYENRYPDSIGMLAIQANEVSQHHHIGSYFNDHAGGILETEAETLKAIAEKNGLAVLFHPGDYDGSRPSRPFYPVEWYVDLFQHYDNLIGMEAYTTGLMFQPGNINKWDSTLMRLMPGRPVWGFSNEDYHSDHYVNTGEVRHVMGRNGNIFLLPELSIEEVRSGMENGVFYFFHAPEGYGGPSPPVINSIKVNSRRGTIYIEASGFEYIEWISDGAVVYTGDHIDITDVPGVGNYVRANIYESAGGAFVGTQPFGIRRP